MARTDLQRLIDRGRKAGLGTTEMYRALNSRRPEAGDAVSQPDGNGFVMGYGSNGQPVMQPNNGRPAS